MEATYALIALLVLLIAYYVFLRKRRMNVFQKYGIVGPKPHFIYGNLIEIRRDGVLKCVDKWLNEYGPIFGYYNGGRPNLVVTDPELLKLILVKDFKLFRNRNVPIEFAQHKNTQLAKSNLLRRKGKRWKELRTLLRPAFSAVKLKGSMPETVDAVNTLLENVEKDGKNGDTDIEIYKLYQGLTLDVIGRNAFGVRTNVQKDPNDPFLKAMQATFVTLLNNAFTKPLLLFPEFAAIMNRIRLLVMNIQSLLIGTPYKYIFELSTHIILKRRQESKRNDLLQSMIDGRINAQMATEIDYDSLSMSSELEKSEAAGEYQGDRQLTDAEIISNIILFFEAGYETTSTALAFITHALVNHADVQQKVRQEVLEVVNKEGNLDYNALAQLPFMDAVINEALRIYPPLTFFVTRVSETDYKYKDITIPKEMPVVSPVYHIHHNPKFWNEPEKFDPYRFFGKNKSKTNILWQSFGVGPRNCIGMRFALLEIKLTLAKLLFKYEMKPGPRTEIEHLTATNVGILYKPSHVYVRFVPLASN